jgi:hypothetical protein
VKGLALCIYYYRGLCFPGALTHAGPWKENLLVRLCCGCHGSWDWRCRLLVQRPPIDCIPLLGGIGGHSLASRPRIFVRSGSSLAWPRNELVKTHDAKGRTKQSLQARRPKPQRSRNRRRPWHGFLQYRAEPHSSLKIGAHVMTVLPSAVARKCESLRGKNHSYRKGDTH